MKKKYIVLLGILVLIVVAGGIGLAKKSNKPDSSAASAQSSGDTQLNLKFSDLQAHYPPEPDACLANNDDPSLKLDAADQANIVDAVVGTVIDIPAGTNVDVHVKTYDETNATGTSVYESTYGAYNFTAKKHNAKGNSNQGSWVVTDFVACKK